MYNFIHCGLCGFQSIHVVNESKLETIHRQIPNIKFTLLLMLHQLKNICTIVE